MDSYYYDICQYANVTAMYLTNPEQMKKSYYQPSLTLQACLVPSARSSVCTSALNCVTGSFDLCFNMIVHQFVSLKLDPFNV